MSIDYDKKKEVGLGDILSDILSDDIIKGSDRLAQSISDEAKSSSVLKCVIVQPGSTYLLEHSFVPTIVIEFQVQQADSMVPFVKDQFTMGKILNAICAGIERYFTSPPGEGLAKPN